MKLTKAIEQLQEDVNPNIPTGEIAHMDAIRLGIEAMEFFVKHRRPHTAISLPILPSETEE